MTTKPLSAQSTKILFKLPETTACDVVRLFLEDGSYVDVRGYTHGKPDMLTICHIPEVIRARLLELTYGKKVGFWRRVEPEDVRDLMFKISQRTRIDGPLVVGSWYKKHYLDELQIGPKVIAAHYAYSDSLVQCSTLGFGPAQYA